MAITRTHVQNSSITAAQGSFTTTVGGGGFTPSSNDLVIITFCWANNGSLISSVTGNGITYQAMGAPLGVSGAVQACYFGMSASPTQDNITVALDTTSTADGMMWSVERFSGAATGSNGSNAV